MEILLYILAILIFLGIIILAIFLSNRKHKKRIEALKEASVGAEKVETEILSNEKEVPIDEITKAVEAERVKGIEEPVLQAEFEDFVLQSDEDDVSTLENDDEDELDLKFAEYQKFLRENLNLDTDDDEPDKVFERPMHEENFPPFGKLDFEALNRGQAEDDLETILKNMPPKARDIVLSGALEKKEIEDTDVDEEDEG